MRYPMWRRNLDGTEVIVNNREEAYSCPEQIGAFLPHKPIPEQPAEPALIAPTEDLPSEPESAAEQPAEAKRGPGRPRKAI